MIGTSTLSRAYNPYATVEDLGLSGDLALVPYAPYLGDAGVDRLIEQQRKSYYLGMVGTVISAGFLAAMVYQIYLKRKGQS